MVTAEQLKKILPAVKDAEEWLVYLNEMLPAFGITTPRRVAAFLAQSGQESADFNSLDENLRYSAKRLVQVWPSRFTAATAPAYAYKPEKLANHVYCDRMGNGSEASGEGWLYRGRGIKQLTGKYNYTAFAKSAELDLAEAVAYVSTRRGAVHSAVWFWESHDLNRFADKDDNKGLTQAINGGLTGLAERDKRYKNAKAVLETGRDPHEDMFVVLPTPVVPPAPVEAKWPTLRRGETRYPTLVRRLQEALGFTGDGIDGQFGVATYAHVRAYQQREGLFVDGMAGPMTLTRLFGPA